MTPSLTSLLTESQQVPPLSRDSFEQRYLGLRICWQLVFATAVPLGTTGRYQVLATQRTFWQRLGSNAFFQIDPDSFPALRAVRPGRRLRVCGSVREIKAISVTLDVESIDVLAESFFDRYRH